jgi:hypothetical protein
MRTNFKRRTEVLAPVQSYLLKDLTESAAHQGKVSEKLSEFLSLPRFRSPHHLPHCIYQFEILPICLYSRQQFVAVPASVTVQ